MEKFVASAEGDTKVLLIYLKESCTFLRFVLMHCVLNLGNIQSWVGHGCSGAVGSFVGMTVLFYEKVLVLFTINNLLGKC